MNQLARGIRPYLYILPVVLISGVLIYYFIGFTVYASLTDWNGLKRMDFVGLDNYRELMRDPVFWTALKNNLVFMVVVIAVQAVLGLLVAVICADRLPGSNFFKAVFFLPISMAPSIVATVFKYMLEANYGTLNESLRALGLLGKGEVIEWLGADLGVWSLVAINVFQWMGFSMMIYFAGIMSIPHELYEAAMIDGAGWWRRLFSVTIPSLSGVTKTLIVLGIVGNLKTFDIVWLTTQGGPGNATHFLTTMLYQERSSREAGYASAIGTVLLVLAFVLTLAQTAWSARKERR
ncbi:MAG: sugar ABC transporter permease [Actinomyces urogenitalis]|uniref:carbohydrate ABC transporter permease n=1 Tax=Actinomyces urogenitalis TaxID=103621 RepID=UPI00242E976D|nr:sugar ABC transporter permease [Actinomyces urogenitalis]MCI7457337.1 sugar ABC transporter permease [Actinomyces urogenitalis]MDY3679364.1 sugar ABC transporter permease [Actinomyces urogenitalis]